MDFDPQVARHQTDDPLDLGRLEPLTGIDPALAEPVETQAAIRIDHHLDDRRVGERGADRRPHGGAQHGPLASPALGMAVVAAHRSDEHTYEIQSLMSISYAALR